MTCLSARTSSVDAGGRPKTRARAASARNRCKVSLNNSFDVREGGINRDWRAARPGTTQLAALAVWRYPVTGTINFNGRLVHFRHPRQAMKVRLCPGSWRPRPGGICSTFDPFWKISSCPSWARYGFPLKINKAKKDAKQMGDRLNLVMPVLQEPVQQPVGRQRAKGGDR